MKLKDLRSNPQNPRTLKDTSFKKLLNKILVYPRLLEKNKITFDSEQQNVILGGNMRFKTLKYICSTYRPDDIETAIKTAQNALNIDSDDLLKNSVSVFSELIETETLPKSWTQDAKGLSEEEKQAFIIIDNVSDGDWDFDVLANGWDIELNEWGLVDYNEDGISEEATDFFYNTEITSPTYEPKQEFKPKENELYNLDYYNKLIKSIDANNSLSEEERTFLKLAASRHIKFNYELIAEYYSHADKNLQELMEDNALIIIDFNKAIELGFVALDKRMNELKAKNG